MKNELLCPECHIVVEKVDYDTFVCKSCSLWMCESDTLVSSNNDIIYSDNPNDDEGDK
jgi:phage pi2 protein 07